MKGDPAMRSMMIGIGSTASAPGDVAGNLAQIAALAARAAANGCALLLTPELSATGYGGYPAVLACAEPAGAGPIWHALAELAARHELVVTAGFVEAAGARRHLAHYVVYPDGQTVVQRKHRVTPREAPLEPAVPLFFDDTEEIGHVPPGQAHFVPFAIAGVRCALVICADLGVRERRALLRRDAIELLLLPTGAGGTRGERFDAADLAAPDGMAQYLAALRAACDPGDGARECIEDQRALAAVNMVGFDGLALYHGGQGSIVDPSGDVVALLPGIPLLARQQARFACGTVLFR
jgi:predicted amidohydrolase